MPALPPRPVTLSLFPEDAPPPPIPPSPALTPQADVPLPAGLPAAVWRGTDMGAPGIATVSSGFEALDAELPGGGWPSRSLSEILQAQPSLCEWRLLGPALQGLVARGGKVMLVGPPKRPHLPGLLHHGLSEKDLLWIHADSPAERLWATEQLIKAHLPGAILSWLPQARPEQLRRLQVHAQACDAPVFLFRPALAQCQASPAPLRVLATLGERWQLNVQVLKRRGPLHEGWVALQAIPGGLSAVLPPRLFDAAPSHPVHSPEVPHVDALGRLAPQRQLPAVAGH